jgi:hypothetical protein
MLNIYLACEIETIIYFRVEHQKHKQWLNYSALPQCKSAWHGRTLCMNNSLNKASHTPNMALLTTQQNKMKSFAILLPWKISSSPYSKRLLGSLNKIAFLEMGCLCNLAAYWSSSDWTQRYRRMEREGRLLMQKR